MLGRTGQTVSRVGLGCGGHSRLGLATGKTEAEAVALVRRALDAGITLLDTAESYGTEGVVGRALAEAGSDTVFVSTKVHLGAGGDARRTGAQLIEAVHGCRRRLGRETIDLVHLHGVRDSEYDHAVAELVPALERLRTAGAIRFQGITEAFVPDPQHALLARAVQDPFWDVVMVGYNVLNQSARQRVFPHTQAQRIGTLGMFACRRALSDPAALRTVLETLEAEGRLSDDARALGLANLSAEALTERAYQFCKAEPGIDVVLFGTGNPAHLDANLRALGGTLPTEQVERLRSAFAGIDHLSGN